MYEFICKQNWFSLIGLIFDMAGVILLFIYGLPSKYNPIPGAKFIVSHTFEDIKSKVINDNNKIVKWSHLGLKLLIIGFICQFIGTLKF